MPKRFTGRDFDAMSRNSGRGAAVKAAVAAGGALVLGGRRVNLPGGGSRLAGKGRGRQTSRKKKR